MLRTIGSSITAAAMTLLATACLAADKAPTKPSAEQLAPVQRLAQAFNNKESATPDVFTDDCQIIDDFAPYTWQGKEGVNTWYAAVVKFLQSPGDLKMKLMPAKSFNAEGDRAYYVLPAVFDYAENGKQHVQTADWLIVVAKSGDQWKIAAHSWAINTDLVSAGKKPAAKTK